MPDEQQQTLGDFGGGQISSALMSDDRRYRFSLHRIWNGEKELVAFIGLNPSTADEKTDDPTIRRCMGFAREWGFGGIVMLNLYAWRATQPTDLEAVQWPVGNPVNDGTIDREARRAALVVAAWGASLPRQGGQERADEVRARLEFDGLDLRVFGLTASGAPRHPLYLPGSCIPIPWSDA